MSNRRRWIRRGLLAALLGLVAQQAWRHGRDYVFADQFAVVEPGKIYRGAWQQPWPMRRVVQQYKVKTVLALAHPPDHPLAVREKAMARELGYRWVHIPIVDERSLGDWRVISDQPRGGGRGPRRPPEPSHLLPLPSRNQPRLDGSNGLPDQVLWLDA